MKAGRTRAAVAVVRITTMNKEVNEAMLHVAIANYLEKTFKGKREWIDAMKKDLLNSSSELVDGSSSGVSIELEDASSSSSASAEDWKKGWGLLEKKFGLNATLDEIFNVGLTSVGASFMFSTDKKGSSTTAGTVGAGAGADTEDFENDERYIRYKRKLEEKGFFAGVEAGTEEYERRMKKLRQAFIEKVLNAQGSASGKADTKPLTKEEREERIKEADSLKEQGNNALKEEEYEKAADLYSQAINICPNEDNSNNERMSIYFSNRSAAYTLMKKHEDALDDCKVAVSLNPQYAKAHLRLATGYYTLKKYEEAIESAKKTLELQPDNEAAKETLSLAQKALKKKKARGGNNDDDEDEDGMDIYSGSNKKSASGAPNLGGAGGMPDLSQLMSQLGGMDMSNLSAMMQDPNIMNAAAQMANDPRFASLLGGAGGPKPRR